MANFFDVVGDQTRPGVYQRYENVGGAPLAGAINGVVAVVLKGDRKEGEKEVITLNNITEATDRFGLDNMINEIFVGGAKTVKAVCVKPSTTISSISLSGTNLGVAKNDLIEIRSKDLKKKINITLIKENLGDEQQKVKLTFTVNSKDADGVAETPETLELEVSYGANQAYELLKAFKEKTSKYITMKEGSDNNLIGSVKLDEISVAKDLIEKTYTTQPNDYINAFNFLEPHDWNVICIDSTDNTLCTAMHARLKDMYKDSGKMAMAVFGTNPTDTFEEKLEVAKLYDDYLVVCFGGSWVAAGGKIYQGHEAAARIAGMIASTPSNESVTHKVIRGAVNLNEFLTVNQYKQAIENGMMVISSSYSGSIWIESGINSFRNDDLLKNDAGWKKIKRTKVRFELMNRASATVETLIGKINNNVDGRSIIIQSVQGILNNMIAEQKLAAGAYIEEDPNYTASGDSACFNIWANDVDSMEKIYFAFKFNFSLSPTGDSGSGDSGSDDSGSEE